MATHNMFRLRSRQHEMLYLVSGFAFVKRPTIFFLYYLPRDKQFVESVLLPCSVADIFF